MGFLTLLNVSVTYDARSPFESSLFINFLTDDGQRQQPPLPPVHSRRKPFLFYHRKYILFVVLHTTKLKIMCHWRPSMTFNNYYQQNIHFSLNQGQQQNIIRG